MPKKIEPHIFANLVGEEIPLDDIVGELFVKYKLRQIITIYSILTLFIIISIPFGFWLSQTSNPFVFLLVLGFLLSIGVIVVISMRMNRTYQMNELKRIVDESTYISKSDIIRQMGH